MLFAAKLTSEKKQIESFTDELQTSIENEFQGNPPSPLVQSIGTFSIQKAFPHTRGTFVCYNACGHIYHNLIFD